MAKKILLVDDDEATLKLLKPFLVTKGFEVETAIDGLQGFEKVKSWKPDLVVLDVIMPRMDGYGFVHEIKKDLKLRALPVVVLTAREMMRDVFMQEGIRDYVIKPYDPQELLKMIQRHF